MPNTVAALRISLGLDSAAFDSGVRQVREKVTGLGGDMNGARSALARFEQGLNVSNGRVNALGINLGQAGTRMRAFEESTSLLRQRMEALDEAQSGVHSRTGLMRAGMVNLGYQLQDVASSFASGGHAATIFAQQSGQLVGAIAMISQAGGATSGLLGRFATFMSGPWGIALGVGVSVAGVLAQKLFDTGDAADKAAPKVDKLAAALDKLKGAPMQVLGALNMDVVQAQAKVTQIQRRTPLSRGQAIDRAKELQDAQLALQDAQGAFNSANDVYNKWKGSWQSNGSSGAASGGGGHSGRQATAASGMSQVAKEAGNAAAAIKSLTAELFPQIGVLDQYKDKLKAIDDAAKLGAVAPVLAEKLRTKLRTDMNLGAKGLESLGAANDNPITLSNEKLDALRESITAVGQTTVDTAMGVDTQANKIGASFEQMSDRAIGALQHLSYAVKSGDFIDILGGILDLGKTLGGLGVFGKSVQSSINSYEHHADGGPSLARRAYMVGKRGPELFVPGTSGRIVPNAALGGGGSRVQIIPSKYFDVVVDGRVLSAAPTIAAAGGEVGMARMARAQSRRLG